MRFDRFHKRLNTVNERHTIICLDSTVTLVLKLGLWVSNIVKGWLIQKSTSR